jgi:hypothetical protein
MKIKTSIKAGGTGDLGSGVPVPHNCANQKCPPPSNGEQL